ncbi:MAG: hypothetical protein WAM88_02635 [Nitrososphaeraceae archaeon]
MTSSYYVYRDLLVVMKILSQVKYNSNRMLVVQKLEGLRSVYQSSTTIKLSYKYENDSEKNQP